MVEKPGAEGVVRDIKRRTRKKYSSEEKIRIVLEGLRGEMSIAELCRKEGIQPNVYYTWSKEFLEAGKRRLQGDTAREATSSEVVDLRKENPVRTYGLHEHFRGKRQVIRVVDNVFGMISMHLRRVAGILVA